MKKKRTIKRKTIKKEILKKLTSVSWKENKESTLTVQYSKLKQLFFELFEKERMQGNVQESDLNIQEDTESELNFEEKERLILSQAFLIMKRIYTDHDAPLIFEKNMENPTKEITKTDDFLEFIGRLSLS